MRALAKGSAIFFLLRTLQLCHCCCLVVSLERRLGEQLPASTQGMARHVPPFDCNTDTLQGCIPQQLARAVCCVYLSSQADRGVREVVLPMVLLPGFRVS